MEFGSILWYHKTRKKTLVCKMKGRDIVTVQQQVCNRIINMSDEGAIFINQVINNMNPVFFTNKAASAADNNIDVSKRIGAGKGILTDSEDFDKWNDEIADLFEGVAK